MLVDNSRKYVRYFKNAVASIAAAAAAAAAMIEGILPEQGSLIITTAATKP